MIQIRAGFTNKYPIGGAEVYKAWTQAPKPGGVQGEMKLLLDCFQPKDSRFRVLPKGRERSPSRGLEAEKVVWQKKNQERSKKDGNWAMTSKITSATYLRSIGQGGTENGETLYTNVSEKSVQSIKERINPQSDLTSHLREKVGDYHIDGSSDGSGGIFKNSRNGLPDFGPIIDAADPRQILRDIFYHKDNPWKKGNTPSVKGFAVKVGIDTTTLTHLVDKDEVNPPGVSIDNAQRLSEALRDGRLDWYPDKSRVKSNLEHAFEKHKPWVADPNWTRQFPPEALAAAGLSPGQIQGGSSPEERGRSRSPKDTPENLQIATSFLGRSNPNDALALEAVATSPAGALSSSPFSPSRDEARSAKRYAEIALESHQSKLPKLDLPLAQHMNYDLDYELKYFENRNKSPHPGSDDGTPDAF